MSTKKRRGAGPAQDNNPRDAPLNGPDVPFEDKQRELEGRRSAASQGEAVIQREEIGDRSDLTPSAIYQGDLEAGRNDDVPNDSDNLALLVERELRDGETANPFEAVEEGLTYIPPSDPPVVPSAGLDDAVVASGMGASALEEAYTEDQHQSFYPADDELTARVREALRADSSTSEYADHVRIVTRGAVVVLRGEVTDLDDSDNLAAVAAYVEGVDEVIDELRVRTLE